VLSERCCRRTNAWRRTLGIECCTWQLQRGRRSPSLRACVLSIRWAPNDAAITRAQPILSVSGYRQRPFLRCAWQSVRVRAAAAAVRPDRKTRSAVAHAVWYVGWAVGFSSQSIAVQERILRSGL
jgi:hypothetical protein